MIYISAFFTLISIIVVVALSALVSGLVRYEWRENKWLALCYILFWLLGIILIALYTARIWLVVL